MTAGVRRLDLGHPADVSVGEIFEVSVPTAASAGLSLAVDYPEAIRLVSERGEVGRKFGARGLAIFRFECRQKGDFAIAFRQARPWSGEARVSTICIRCED